MTGRACKSQTGQIMKSLNYTREIKLSARVYNNNITAITLVQQTILF